MASDWDEEAWKTAPWDEGFAPAIIVSLVHGTFSPDAEWTREESTFRTNLLAGLAGSGLVHVRRFTWSGGNNLFERLEAETALREDIWRVYLRFPDSQHFIIAHSHGGNIAYGLLAGHPTEGVTGIVCLATPFVHLRFRDEVLDRSLLQRSWVSILSLLACVVSLATATSFWAFPIIILGCVLLGSLIGIVFSAWLDVIAPPVRALVERARLRRNIPILNLRGPGDEAGFVLSFGQMIDWACSSMHRRIMLRTGFPKATILPGRWGALFGLWVGCALLSLILLFGIHSVNGSYQAGERWFLIIIAFAVVGSLMIKTYWLDNLTLGILSVLLVASHMLANIWFGTTLPTEGDQSKIGKSLSNLLFPMLLEIRTESAPPGCSEVTYLPASPVLPDPVEGRLTHGIYDHPSVPDLIANWMIEKTNAKLIAQRPTDFR